MREKIDENCYLIWLFPHLFLLKQKHIKLSHIYCVCVSFTISSIFYIDFLYVKMSQFSREFSLFISSISLPLLKNGKSRINYENYMTHLLFLLAMREGKKTPKSNFTTNLLQYLFFLNIYITFFSFIILYKRY